jgi:purine-cytosine permease-like protein
MSFALAVELSIAMPLSWLPLAGDYARRAESRGAAFVVPFAGYFTGSVFMYGFGLYLALAGGGDIFSFIAGSRFRLAACAVALLSTLTTAFLDLYSAALSSRRLVKTKTERGPVLAIGLFAVLVSALFPVERYSDFLENFLLLIGMVFVPVYTILFLDFLLKRPRHEKPFHRSALAAALGGMAGYRLFSVYSLWIPTLMTIVLTALLYSLGTLLPARLSRGKR